MKTEQLESFCQQMGIAPEYLDNWDKAHRPSSQALEAIIRALNPGLAQIETTDQSIEAVVEGCLSGLSEGVAGRAVFVVQQSGEVSMPLSSFVQQGAIVDSCAAFSWKITTEAGEMLEGDCERDNTGNKSQLCIRLPHAVQPGYHSLLIAGPHDDEKLSPQSSPQLSPQRCCKKLALIVVPQAAWCPDLERRATGISLQLYSLRTQANWGIGDFSDLRKFCAIAADAGLDVVGLNPLHALYSAHPQRCSPYSPTSRYFLNPIYIDVTAVPGSDRCADLQTYLRSHSLRRELELLRDTDTVQYPRVAALKMQALWLLFKEIYNQTAAAEHPDHQQACQRFSDFLDSRSDSLDLYARFEAFDEYFLAESGCTQWQQWPEACHNPRSAESLALASKLDERIRFHLFMQWVAIEQLESVVGYCRDRGMRYGLYLDLAVGVDRQAGDIWAYPELYAIGVHIGAPPDELGPMGQDWSLTPWNPLQLRQHIYQPFIQLLQANMQYAGVLRLDHVMGLMRQYWCVPALTPNASESNGTYMEFPFQDLLGILALESHRNQCLVVGEDLGTVPDGFREALAQWGILGYRVLYFEKDNEESFKSPASYALKTLATASTHDLPPLTGYFRSADIRLRADLGLYPDDLSIDDLLAKRQSEISQLQVLADGSVRADQKTDDSKPVADAAHRFVSNVHRALGQAGSHIVMLQLEDVLGQQDMVNMPGTIEEHPNWCRRLPLKLEDIRSQVLDAACISRLITNRKVG